MNGRTGKELNRKNNTKRPKPALLEKLAEITELPEENLSPCSSVTILESRKAEISGCRGVLEYSSSRIVFQTRSGSISVHGTDMELCSLLNDQITVRGSISDLHFSSEKGGTE